MTVDLRTVDCFVTASRPAGALRQTIGVIGIADENAAARFLLLKVAFQTKSRVALSQHAGIDGTVR